MRRCAPSRVLVRAASPLPFLFTPRILFETPRTFKVVGQTSELTNFPELIASTPAQGRANVQRKWRIYADTSDGDVYDLHS